METELLKDYIVLSIEENDGIPLQPKDGQGLLKWKPIAEFADWAFANKIRFTHGK